MCVAFKSNGKEYRPGARIKIKGPEGTIERTWVSYARSEKSLYWERSRNAMQVVVEASSFAERDRRTHQLVWADIPQGHYIRAYLADPKDKEEFLIEPENDCYIVTRKASPEEQDHFGHDRLPLIEPTPIE